VAKEIHWDPGSMVLSIMMHLVRVLHGCGLITMGYQTHERAPYSVLVAMYANRLQIMHGSGMAVDQLFRQRYRHLIHHQLHLRQTHLLIAPQCHLVYYQQEYLHLQLMTQREYLHLLHLITQREYQHLLQLITQREYLHLLQLMIQLKYQPYYQRKYLQSNQPGIQRGHQRLCHQQSLLLFLQRHLHHFQL